MSLCFIYADILVSHAPCAYFFVWMKVSMQILHGPDAHIFFFPLYGHTAAQTFYALTSYVCLECAYFTHAAQHPHIHVVHASSPSPHIILPMRHSFRIRSLCTNYPTCCYPYILFSPNHVRIKILCNAPFLVHSDHVQFLCGCRSSQESHARDRVFTCPTSSYFYHADLLPHRRFMHVCSCPHVQLCGQSSA